MDSGNLLSNISTVPFPLHYLQDLEEASVRAILTKIVVPAFRPSTKVSTILFFDMCVDAVKKPLDRDREYIHK